MGIFHLTPRDLKLFTAVHGYGFLRTKDIAEMIFPGAAVTNVLRRLRTLEDHGYLLRTTGFDAGAVAWLLTFKSSVLVSEMPHKSRLAKYLLEHDLALLKLRLKFEKEGLVSSWLPEHSIRSQMARRHGTSALREKTVPDGIAVVSYHKELRSVAIEVELNFKNRQRYEATAKNYSEKERL